MRCEYVFFRFDFEQNDNDNDNVPVKRKAKNKPMVIEDDEDKDEAQPSGLSKKEMKEAKKKQKEKRKKKKAARYLKKHFETYWRSPAIDYKKPKRNSIATVFDSRSTDVMRRIAVVSKTYLFPIRNKKSKPSKTKTKSTSTVTTKSGNKYLHNDLKMFVLHIFITFSNVFYWLSGENVNAF